MNKAYITKWVKISIIMICKEETNIGRISNQEPVKVDG
jgi:hypothetical protein